MWLGRGERTPHAAPARRAPAAGAKSCADRARPAPTQSPLPRLLRSEGDGSGRHQRVFCRYHQGVRRSCRCQSTNPTRPCSRRCHPLPMSDKGAPPSARGHAPVVTCARGHDAPPCAMRHAPCAARIDCAGPSPVACHASCPSRCEYLPREISGPPEARFDQKRADPPFFIRVARPG
jgi:hypothetical protein